MASVVYNEFKHASANSYLSGADLRVALVMTNTTCDTENDGIVNIDDFTTLDEMDGSGYSRQALTSEAWTKDDGNDRAELDAADATFSSLGNGTREVQGALLYKHVTDDTDAEVIAFIEFSSTQNPGGSDLTLQWNAEGILQLS